MPASMSAQPSSAMPVSGAEAENAIAATVSAQPVRATKAVCAS